MRINLSNSKDCKNCERSEVYGDNNSPNITCNSTDSIHYNLFKKDGRFCATYCKGYKERENKDVTIARQGMIELSRALPYMLAGKSEFVMHSSKTNQDFTYRLTRKESKDSTDDNNKYIYFLNIKMGHDWVYAGVLWYDYNTNTYKFATGKSGKVEPSDLNVRSLLFVMNKLQINEIPQYCTIFHTGKCGVCGKKLTTPESILTGLGPSCSKRVGVPRIKLKNT